MKAIVRSGAVILLLIAVASPCSAQFKAAVRQLSTTDTYVALVKAIAEETQSTIETQVVPGARAAFLLVGGDVNLMLPDIKPVLPEVVAAAQYSFSTASIFPMAFVLYTNPNKPVDLTDLKAGNKKGAKIEVDVSQVSVFEFKGSSSTNLEGSLQKVDRGLIDGFIFSQATGDTLLKKLGLKNVKRQLYGNFPMHFGVPKGSLGSGIDKVLTDGMASLKAKNKLDPIIGSLAKASVYNDWQP